MSAEPAGPPTEDVYGLLSLNDAEVALPLSMLREALDCPPEFSSLPVAADGLLGAMDIRGLVVPVIDLRPRMGLAAPRAEHNKVVLVSDGERLLGVLADEIRSVTRVPARDLMPITASGGELFVTHTFRHPEDGHIVSVLNGAKILQLPGVPTSPDPAAHQDAVALSVAGVSRRKLTVLRCGDFVLGLDPAHVHTTLPGSAAQPSMLDSAICRGVIDYVGNEVAVLDPLSLLGLGSLAPDAVGPGLVLKMPDGYVVLALSALLEIVDVRQDDILAVPQLSLQRPGLVSGLAESSFGPCLVLDGDQLYRDPELRALASVNVATHRTGAESAVVDVASRVALSDGSVSGAGLAVGAAQLHLGYRIGMDVTSPLEQISEILAYPEVLTPTGGQANLLGVITHRNVVVPVICLATTLGRRGDAAIGEGCLLLVSSHGRHVAYLVDALSAIEPLTWRDERTTTAVSYDPSQALKHSPLIKVGDDDRLVPDLDLLALTDLILGSELDIEGLAA